MKILPVGAEFFHVNRRADERTDMMKPIVAFRNFSNAPKNDHAGIIVGPNSLQPLTNTTSRCYSSTRYEHITRGVQIF